LGCAGLWVESAGWAGGLSLGCGLRAVLGLGRGLRVQAGLGCMLRAVGWAGLGPAWVVGLWGWACRLGCPVGLGPVQGWFDGAGLRTGLGLVSAMG